jgi:hypothetical protein
MRPSSVLLPLRDLQVYVTVYSDGPTRVLRLSDEPNVTSSEAEQSVLDLAARLKQVRCRVRVQWIGFKTQVFDVQRGGAVCAGTCGTSGKKQVKAGPWDYWQLRRILCSTSAS